MAAEQRAALLVALQDWDAWLTAREVEAAPGYIVYRPAGDCHEAGLFSKKGAVQTFLWVCLIVTRCVLHSVHRSALTRFTRSFSHSSLEAIAVMLGAGPDDRSGGKGPQAAPADAGEGDEAAPVIPEVSPALPSLGGVHLAPWRATCCTK